MDLAVASLFSTLRRQGLSLAIAAGGDGSGRYSEAAIAPINKPLHKQMLRSGWTHKGTEAGKSVYHHPLHGTVSVHMGDMETANYHGENIPDSKCGYVSDDGQCHLPTNTPGRAKNALARVNQTQNIPGGKKQGVLQKIRRIAKKHGTNVSNEPTSKQKTWTKEKKK